MRSFGHCSSNSYSGNNRALITLGTIFAVAAITAGSAVFYMLNAKKMDDSRVAAAAPPSEWVELLVPTADIESGQTLEPSMRRV